MNKQLLRLKQRSNGDILQVAECDDSNNLMVNVADSVGISGIDENGNETPIRSSQFGYLLTKDVQSAIQFSVQEEYPFGASSPQYTGEEHVFDLPTGDITSKYYVMVYNPSNITDLNMYVMNKSVIGSNSKFAALYDKSNTAAPIVVPKSQQVLLSDTAWSSCFTSINNVLSDESNDINDAGASDVPFAFGAVDDAIYFGAVTRYDRIRVTTGTIGVYDATFTWEYWNGSAWTALTEVVDDTNITVTNGTQPFKRTGTHSISFYPPHDWTAYDIAGNPTSQYWIRARVATFTSITAGPSLSRGWYKRVGVPDVHAFLVEGVYGGDECKITLETATALGADDAFNAYVKIKRL